MASDLTDEQRFSMWARHVLHARTNARIANPLAGVNHVFVGRDIQRMCLVSAIANPPTALPNYESGRAGRIGGLDIVPAPTLAPDEWQLKDQHGTIRDHGRLTDLEP